MLLSCENIGITYGERILFSGVSFFLERKDRLCIIGKNGCGKSSLLDCIAGIYDEYDGKIDSYKSKISYFKQQTDSTSDELSGGEQTRLALARVFDEKPDILLLDEPTNHLDLKSIEKLEQDILSFSGAVILISHDRFLIDRLSTKILDLNTTPAFLYKGNFEDYLQKKEVIRLSAEREAKNFQDKVAHEQAVIAKLKQFNREKSIKRAESREKMLAKLTGPDVFIDTATKMSIRLDPLVLSGKDVLTVTDISKSYGDRTLFSEGGFFIGRGEHIALIGDNGTGKSTIFNIIRGITEADSGEVKLGTNVSVSYYAQDFSILNSNGTVYDEIRNEHVALTETIVRNSLAAFSFFEDDLNRKISTLSGGEKGRLCLCKLMLNGSNFLLLDEPTNHLDMESRDILMDAVNSYSGTVLFISHDRYFINGCADRVLEISNERIYEYLGGYDDYMEKKQELISKGIISEKIEEAPVKEKSEGRLSYEEEKKKKAALEKQARDEAKIMAQIEKFYERISEIEVLEAENSNSYMRLSELHEEKIKVEAEIEGLYEKLES